MRESLRINYWPWQPLILTYEIEAIVAKKVREPMLTHKCLILWSYFPVSTCNSASRRFYSTSHHISPLSKDIFLINPVRDADLEPQVVRSILRSLFREATYLPDKTARSWVTRQIRKKSRYNEYERDPAKIASLLRAAKKQYSLLKRANLGARLPLLKILRHTYGRVGSRRYVLLEKYIRPLPTFMATGTKHNLEERVSSDSSVWKSSANPGEIVADPKQEGDNNIFSLSNKYDNLKYLLRSQKTTLGYPNTLNLIIPRRNAWLQSVPTLTVRNRITKWYEYLLENVKPPLPAIEWESLKAKAWGFHVQPIPVRRQILSSCDDIGERRLPRLIIQHAKDEELEDEHWLEAAGPSILNAEACCEKIRLPERGKVGRHKMTTRYVQRQLTAVFRECPIEIWDEKLHRPKFKWGSPKTKFLHLQGD